MKTAPLYHNMTTVFFPPAAKFSMRGERREEESELIACLLSTSAC